MPSHLLLVREKKYAALFQWQSLANCWRRVHSFIYHIQDDVVVCELVDIDLEEGGHIVDMLWYFMVHFVVITVQKSGKDVVNEWSVD